MPTFGSSIYRAEGKKFLLTPSFDLSYARAANIHAGVLVDLSKNKEKAAYPFVSATADLLQLFSKGSANSLKVFGSYASVGYFMDQYYSLSDFSYPPSRFAPTYSAGSPILTVATPDQNYSNIQAGSVLNLFAQRLSISYNYERRDYFAYVVLPNPPGGGTGYSFALPNALANSHRVFVEWKAIDKSNISWRTGLHATSIKNDVDMVIQPNYFYDIVGDVNDESRSWTGGWNNRIELKNFSFGADLAYHFRKNTASFMGSPPYNLFALQHIYAAYKTTIKNNHSLEIYLSSRNSVMNDDYVRFNDNRQYFGAGFSLGF
jgi:hypothetical protein